MVAPKKEAELAVDRYLSNVETLLIALSQRGITDEQMDRLAGILERSWRDLLSRSTRLRAMDRQTARAARSTAGSRKAA